jgi:hypothetical protein
MLNFTYCRHEKQAHSSFLPVLANLKVVGAS